MLLMNQNLYFQEKIYFRFQLLYNTNICECLFLFFFCLKVRCADLMDATYFHVQARDAAERSVNDLSEYLQVNLIN